MGKIEPHQLVANFAELVAAMRDPAHIWPAMLQQLVDAIGFDSGYIAASWSTPTMGRGAIIGYDEPWMKRNHGRLLGEITKEELAGYVGRARRFQDIWPPERRREMAVFNEVLDPAGVTEMIVRVSIREGNVAGFNLERRGKCQPFTDHDLMLVDTVAPFLHFVEVLTLESQDDQHTRNFAARHGLSKREAEFLDLTVRGLQNGEIAILTGVSINTVRNTLVKVFQKANVTNRAELTFLATRPESDEHRLRKADPALTVLPDPGMERYKRQVQAIADQNAKAASERLKLVPSTSAIVYSPMVPDEDAPRRP